MYYYQCGEEVCTEGYAEIIKVCRNAYKYAKNGWNDYLEEGHNLSDSEKIIYLEHIINEFVTDMEKTNGKLTV